MPVPVTLRPVGWSPDPAGNSRSRRSDSGRLDFRELPPIGTLSAYVSLTSRKLPARFSVRVLGLKTLPAVPRIRPVWFKRRQDSSYRLKQSTMMRFISGKLLGGESVDPSLDLALDRAVVPGGAVIGFFEDTVWFLVQDHPAVPEAVAGGFEDSQDSP